MDTRIILKISQRLTHLKVTMRKNTDTNTTTGPAETTVQIYVLLLLLSLQTIIPSYQRTRLRADGAATN